VTALDAIARHSDRLITGQAAMRGSFTQVRVP
jgi:hypothetical protein